MKKHSFVTAKPTVVLFTVVLAVLLLIAVVPVSKAADSGYPKKPINFYLPYPPGGSLDILFRPMADVVGKLLGQPVVTTIKPGASGVLMATMLKTMPRMDMTSVLSAQASSFCRRSRMLLMTH
jgi:tripartite-type tricarboxylate transporter receptor subunit TctC